MKQKKTRLLSERVCELSKIKEKAFFDLRKLETLDLSGNDLTNLANGTLRGPVWLGTWTGPSLFLETLDLSDNGMVNAPRKLWDHNCDSRVPTLTITPGNPGLRTCGTQVWSATLTVGGQSIPGLFGWDGDDTVYTGDALTDADFVYENETYEISEIISTSTKLSIKFDNANLGSIADEDVRKLMTLYVGGTRLDLGDVESIPLSSGDHQIVWEDAGLTWAAGDTVELAIRVK